MAIVDITPAAQRQMEALPKGVRADVLNVFERLRSWPTVSGARPLRHGLAGRFRIRTGHYRVQFHAHSDVVVVEKIGHRDGFYDE
jgi:mRNA-degrading endonuclease RelE of RelBE toxin-antitoxin system